MKVHASLRIVAALIVCGTLAVASTAQATVISSMTQISTDPSVPGDISNSDLVNSGSSALSGSPSVTGYSAAIGGLGNASVVMNDGLHGYNTGGLNLAASSSTWTLTFALDGAYDIGSIVTHSASNDNRYDQIYDILFEYDGDPGNFVPFATIDYKGQNIPNGGHWKVTVTDDSSSTLAADVTGIRFAFAQGQFAATVYSEVDVFEASAVPEPSTFALAGLGLIGLAGWGIRRRRKG